MGSFNNLFIENLMGNLHLNANPLLSSSLDDLLFQDDPISDSDEPLFQPQTPLAREESKLEREIIKIIRSGSAEQTLKPNSGQSVSIFSHNICVGFHSESEYRVWEWHGHVMLFDEENGYVPEYIYGNYFERIGAGNGVENENEKEENGVSGLRELVGEGRDLGNGGGRVVHRNSFSSGLRG